MTFVPTLAALFAATLAPKPTGQVQPGGLPDYSNRFARTAVKALRGDYGKLHDWQREGYERGLKLGIPGDLRLILTQYNYNEPDGKRDRYGRDIMGHYRKYGLRHCALAKRLVANHGPMENGWVWTERYGIRQVLDCGANSNESHKEFRKARHDAGWEDATWCDYWFTSGGAARRAGLDDWQPNRGAIIRR